MSSVEGFRGSVPGFQQESQLEIGRQRLHSQGVDVLPKVQTIKEHQPRMPLHPPPKPPIHERTVDLGEKHYTLARPARYGGLPEHTQFMDKAGRPKEDRLFGLWKMSTGYRNLLGGLELYHQRYGQNALNDVPGRDKLMSTTWLESMRHHLDVLRDRCGRYIRDGGHTRKDAVHELRSQIDHETRVVQRLLNDIEKGVPVPDMPLSEIVAYARQGIQLEDMQELHAQHLSPNQARELIDQQIARARVEERGGDYLREGFTVGEALLLERHDLGIEVGRMYREWNIPITEDTIAKRLTDDMLLGPMKRLGKGKYNEVFTARYETPDGELRGVFKPMKKPDVTRTEPVEKTWVAGKIGIDRYDPQIAMRTLATCETAKLLGFDVVPRTQIGIGTPPPPPRNQEPQLGIVMEQAKGHLARQCDRDTFNHPDVRREVTKLQLLDHLTGQGDRHGNNYFIHQDENGKIIVTGIDNDACFGKEPHDPNGIAYRGNKETEGFNGTTMPPVMDTEMARVFEELTPEALEEALAGKLTDDEIQAAKDRLAGIKEHIQELRKGGMIIAPEQWGDPMVTAALDNTNSYVGRDGGFGPPGHNPEINQAQQNILAQFNLDD